MKKGICQRFSAEFTVLPLLALVFGGPASASAANGAELFTLSPANYETCAPQGPVSGAFWGDYVMRNEEISVCIADPFLLSGRSASRWAIGKVGGAIIALTPRSNPAAATPTAYYPGPLRFKPDAPAFRDEFDAEAANPPWQRPERAPQTGDEVTLEIGAYEIASGKALSELARLPPHLRGAPKPAANVIYSLRHDEPFLRITTIYTNPTATAFVHVPGAIMRADGNWESGLDADNRSFWVYDRQSHATCIVLAGNHTMSARANGAQTFLTQITAEGKNAITIPPGGSVMLESRLFPAASLFAARRLALALREQPMRQFSATVTSGGQAANGVELLARAAGRIIGAGRSSKEGVLNINLPADLEVTLEAIAPGVAPLRQASAAGSTADMVFALPLASTVTAAISGDNGIPIPHKTLIYKEGEPPQPDGIFPLVVWGGVDGLTSAVIAPGRYRLVFSAGAEFDCAEETVDVAPAAAAKVTVALKRSVATPGWISAETHNHTARSGASELYYVYPYTPNTTTDGGSTEPVADKIASLAAEHVEFAPATEHNFSFSYADAIARLGLGEHLATCPGLGLTAGRRHTTTHQNAFPVPYIKGAQDGGAKQREEHIGQLEWLAKWEGHADRVIQIVVPRNDELTVSANMQVLDVVALEPIVERKPIATLDNRILQWLNRLSQGYRLPAVCNAGRFESRQETGRYRNYIRSGSDEPRAIDPLQIARAMRCGQIMMTTGPFMESSVSAAATGASVDAIQETLVAPGGDIRVRVRVQCANWTACDRVQVLVNGTPALDIARAARPELFDSNGAAFDADMPLKLEADGCIVVVASGMGRDLHDKTGDPGARRLHVAVSAPVFVDIDGNGYSVISPLQYQVSTEINFITPPLAVAGAAPGHIRATLVNNSTSEIAEDSLELLVRPGDAFRFYSPRRQSYRVMPGSEASIDWLVAFDDDYLRRNYPLPCNYNKVNTFGVYVVSSAHPPGRKAAAMWMNIDHRIPSLPPLKDLRRTEELLAAEQPLPFMSGQQRAGEMRIGISGGNLAVHAFVADKNPQRRASIIDSSSLEIFGANAGRDATGPDAVSGGYYAVRQVYLVPPLYGKPAESFKRLGTNAKIETAPEIESAFTVRDGGYEVTALVPLELLGIDVDRIKRTQYIWRSGETDVEIVGRTATAGRFMFEARANLPGTAGATTHATVFGSVAPHVDTSAFATMRLISPVACAVAVELPLPSGPDQPPGIARVTLTNTTAETLSDTITLTLAPPQAGEVENNGIMQYSLKAGESISRTFAITPSIASGTVYLVVPRSPLGQVAGTPSPRMPFSARRLVDIGATPVNEAPAKLVKTTAYAARSGNMAVADIHLALAGNDLAISALVREAQIRQDASVWKGSDVEIFGALPGGGSDSIGQVFLVPGTDTLPPRALRKSGADVVDAPGIRVISAKTADGYQLTAFVPLEHLRLSGHAGEIALEVQVSSLVNGKQGYTTIFGSPRAYLDTSRYGVFKTGQNHEE